MRPWRQRGAVLLMVSIVLAIVAALAVAVNRMASAESHATQGDYEARAAAYLADAGVAAATWKNQVACTSTGVAETALGAGTFSAEVGPPAPRAKKLDIVATGAVKAGTGVNVGRGVTRTLQRKQVMLYDLRTAENVRLTRDARNMTIDVLQDEWDDDDERLWLAFDRAHTLLYWATTDIKREMRVFSATLTLMPYGSNGTGGAVAIHRLTTRWDDEASWSRPREDDPRWNGGSYVNPPAATAGVAGSAATDWDVTELVGGWSSGRFPNHGMLLRLANPGPSLRFHSLDASSSRRPVLQVLFARPC